MGLRLQFLLDLGKGCWGVSVSHSSFMIASPPPPKSVSWSLFLALSSPPAELDGNVPLGFEGFSSSANSESESDSDSVWDSALVDDFWVTGENYINALFPRAP